MNTRLRNWIAVGSVSALLIGAGINAPAHADDFTAAQNAIHRDVAAIHDDEARLQGLNHKYNDQRRHGDWRNARGTWQHILYARMDLRKDKELLRDDKLVLSRLRH